MSCAGIYTFCGLKVKSVIRTVHTVKPILSKKGEGQNCGLVYPETATLEYEILAFIDRFLFSIGGLPG